MRIGIRTFFPATLLATAFACTDTSVTAPGGPIIAASSKQEFQGDASVFLADTVAVIVRDPAGRVMSGVRVDWRLAAGSAADLIVLNPASGADGVSRALWRLRPVSTQQTLTASIDGGADAIEFHASVQVGRLDVFPATLILWPGDTVALRAVAYDLAGSQLEDIPTITSDNTALVKIVGGDRVAAVGKGATSLMISAGSLTSHVTAVVIERVAAGELSGQLRTLDGTPVAHVRVDVVTATGSVAGTVDASGRVSVPLRTALGTHEDVMIQIRPTNSNPSFHPATLVTEASQLPFSLVLLPTRWQIERGRFRGEIVKTSIHAAAIASAAEDNNSFWKGRPEIFGYIVPLTTWHPDSFPVRVAIARKLSPHLLANDSVEMWSLFDVLEDYMGRDLFVPAEDNDYDMQNIPTGTVAVAIDRCCGWARPFASPPSEFYIARTDVHSDASSIVVSVSRITTAVVNLGSTNAANFVWHEMFHVLGTGHGCGFVSIQSNCELVSRYAPTPSDIAYWELLMKLQPMGENGLVARSIAAAIIGEARAAGLSLQNQRNRPIVDQVDVHHRTELARFNRPGRPLAQ